MWGEQSRSAFMCALVTVRSAFRGNVEERDGGTEEEKKRNRREIVEGRTEEEKSSPALSVIC